MYLEKSCIDIINAFSSTDKNINFASLFYTTSIIFFGWSYRESRKNYMETDSIYKESINKKIDIYSNLLFSLIDYKNNKNNDAYIKALENNIINSSSYLPGYLIEKFYVWKSKGEPILDNIEQDIYNEVLSLKNKQRPAQYHNKDESIFDMFSYSFYRHKLDTFIYPIGSAIALLFLVLLTIVFSIEFHSLNAFGKFIIFIFSLNSFFTVIIVLGIFDLIMRKKFILKFKDCFIVALFVILPCVISAKWKTEFSIISSLSNLFYMTVLLKKSIKNQSEERV